MRIISGNFKGKKIFFPSSIKTRPLKDMVKESIFNLILHSKKINLKITNSNILDLFSGSGSFGLECISRGAAKVYFFENYNQSIEILNKNIKKLKCENKARVFNKNAFNFFENKELKNKKLDLIFLDPPYKEENIKVILENIAKLKLLKKSGLIVLHRHKKAKDDFGKNYTINRSAKYGISKIIFLKKIN